LLFSEKTVLFREGTGLFRYERGVILVGNGNIHGGNCVIQCVIQGGNYVIQVPIFSFDLRDKFSIILQLRMNDLEIVLVLFRAQKDNSSHRRDFANINLVG